MADLFAPCWHRIQRAEVHRQAAADIWNTWLETDPYDTVVDHEGNGRFVIRVIQESPTPPQMAVLIGEWLYNLRCALDYAVYATAVHDSGKAPPPKEGQLQFPCYFTEVDYKQNEYRISALADHHRTEIIEPMQPYRHENPDTSALGWLHKLARIDRHRRLNLMTAYLAELNPLVGAPEGTRVHFAAPGERVLVDGEARIASFRVSPWQDSWKVEVNPRAGLDPEIGEWAKSAFWRAVRYNERLLMLRVAVETVVVPLEYDCTGASPRAEILTEGFRDQCEAHRSQ